MKRALALSALVAVLASGVALSQAFTHSTGMLSVSLLQPNVAQNDKFEPAHVDKPVPWWRAVDGNALLLVAAVLGTAAGGLAAGVAGSSIEAKGEVAAS